MALRSKLLFLVAFLVFSLGVTVSPASADSLSIVYTSPQNQTATVGPTFTTVVFAGYVLNNTDAPITFQLTGGPEPFEPYVASFIDGIGYPEITLGAGQSTGIIDLATINLQLFDPSLTYPGIVNVVLDAISVDPVTGQTGGTITENDASITVRAVVPEPSTLLLLGSALLVLFLVCCCSPANSVKNINVS
jgi:hypothetical protein